MKKVIFTLIVILLIFTGCTSNKKTKPVINKGFLDLTEWSLDENGSLKLNGEWEFYWNQLLTPEDFKDSTLINQPKDFYSVYKLWNDSTALSSDGYATYRLLVKFNTEEEKQLAIRVPTFATNGKMFVNGQEISTSGIVGKNKDEAEPAYTPHVADFLRDTDEIEIILQVSNYFHKKGGTWHILELGTEKNLENDRDNTILIDFFLCGSIMIMVFYHLGLFLLRRKDKYTLYFALFCLFISLRIVSTGEYLLGKLDFISWDLLIRAEYLSFYVAGGFFAAFLRSLFPNEFSKYFYYFLLIASGLFTASSLFFSPLFFSHFVLYFQGVLLIMAIYTIYVLIRGILNKREGAWAFLLGFIFFFATMINDILFNNEKIDTGNYFSVGVFVFIFSQAFLISSRFSKAFKKTELLTEELNYYNKNLEKIVKERTAEIEQQKEEIMAQKEELQSINDEMQLVNIELEKLSIVARETDNAIVIIDNQANFLWINEGFTKLYGYTFDEYVIKYGKNLLIASTNQNVRTAFENCLNYKKAVTYESFADTKENGKIFLQTTLNPIFDIYHNVTKVIGIETNITKLKEFEQEILQKNEEILAQKDELQMMNIQIQEQNEHIKASIRYAQTIQTAILPSKEKLNQLFENYLIYRPKDVVSGDFYWLNHLSEKKEKGLTEKIFIAVVDCTGHGVPGAFMSLIANRILSEIVNEKLIHSPALILEELNKSVRKTLDQDNSENKDGMDLCLCKIEKDFDGNRTLTYAGAKRPIYYYNAVDKTFKVYESTRRSVGGYISRVEKDFTEKTFLLNKGDLITFSTDGFADQNNEDRKKFSSQQLLSILKNNINLEMGKQKEILESKLNFWLKDTTQRDDITLMTIKI